MGRTPAGQTRERIHRFMRERLLAGTPPTTREVQKAFGFKAVQSARAHLEALVDEGKLVKQPGKARGYRLPRHRGGGATLVPVLGRVPGLKRLFGSSREFESKTELIILLRPIVVDDDSDWSRVIQPAANRISNMNSTGQ